jgi:protein disulfide isomerase family A protein 3
MLVGLFVACCAVALATASDVLEFTDKDFDERIKDHDVILVEFFAPWCGHCKRLAPEYEKAATKLRDNDPPVSIAKVDCTAEKATCDRFGVSGFPTLKIFRKGELSGDYDGPREADGIVKYMRGQVGPSSKELLTLADIEKFLSSDEHSVVGFFEKETKLKDSFIKVADTERDRHRFAHTSAKDILAKYKYTDDIVLFHPKRLHSKFEDPAVKYDGNFDTEKIKKFLTTKIQGLCGHRTSENQHQFEKPLIVAYYNVDYVKDPKGTNYWRNRVLKVASEFTKKKLSFAISNKNDFSHELTEYGFTDMTGDKVIVAGHGEKGEKFPMKAEFSPENLKQFAQQLVDGKLEAYMKSEAVPADNSGPVKVLVAKNFNEIINDEKDALIEFYAPWCGHCKKLTPIYDELGEKMAGEDVVIAKMDATANDVPPAFSVSGFPTIYWKPRGKSAVQYQGGRELDDFVNYIAKESTNPLKQYDRAGKKSGKKAKKEL